MRIALVSPYSWTYPGGVTRHIEALAGRFSPRGTTFASSRPSTRPIASRRGMHRGARPAERELPDWLVPLGRTVGFPANGAVSNLARRPVAITMLRRELAPGASTSSTSTSRSRRSSAGTR